jgi:phosphopantothenoylcysteine decarboxylase/phosphopantothenate--cysteine ligase
MGAALAQACLEASHEVCVISGPVSVTYPDACEVIPVTTTNEMLEATLRLFPKFDGLIGAAAPCDYMPRKVQDAKIAKSGEPLQLELVETPDIVATVAHSKRPNQWVVGFALETEDQHFRAVVKMQKKCCDLMVSNGPSAIDAEDNEVEILASDGTTITRVCGDKLTVARSILEATQTLTN